ncbi:MAG: hypothetical protein QXU47_08980 [Candidatus Bathyarchaeia archaeon]
MHMNVYDGLKCEFKGREIHGQTCWLKPEALLNIAMHNCTYAEITLNIY